MIQTKGKKPATARTVNGLRKMEQLPGRLDLLGTATPAKIQALRIAKRFGVPITTARAIAGLAYPEPQEAAHG